MDHTDVYRLVSEVYAAERVDVLEMEALDGVIAQLEGDIKIIENGLPALRTEAAASRRALSDQRLATQQSYNHFVEFVESSLFPACQRCVSQPVGNPSSTDTSQDPLSSMNALKEWDSTRLERVSSWMGRSNHPQPSTARTHHSSILSILRTNTLPPTEGGDGVTALQFIDHLSRCLPPQALFEEGPLVAAVRAITDALGTIPTIALLRSNIPVPQLPSTTTAIPTEVPKRQRGDDRSTLSFLKGGESRHAKQHNNNTIPSSNHIRRMTSKPAEAAPAQSASPRQLAEVDDNVFVAANIWAVPPVVIRTSRNTAVLSSITPTIHSQTEPPKADASTTTKVKKSRHNHAPQQWSFPDAADVSFAFHKGM